MQQLSAAPRRVPLSLQIVNVSNALAQVGWLIFGFGMLFAWGFVMNGDYSFVTFRGEHPTVEGKLTKVEPTGASVDNRRVQANHYEYSIAGVLHTGTSYSTGESGAAGDRVTVEYDEDQPQRSRVEGMRRAMFSPAIGLIAIFPLIGLGLLISGIVMGLRRNRLLREGILASGKWIAKRATNVRINHRQVYELTFEFTARDGRTHQTKARSTSPERLEDEENEPLLYDPAKPERAYVLDAAPARPRFDPMGDLLGNPKGAVRAMILPAIVIVLHGTILLFKLGVFR